MLIFFHDPIYIYIYIYIYFFGGGQAGTLSGNPLAMTAGIKTLEILKRPGTYEKLDKLTSRLINGILKAGKDAGHAICGGEMVLVGLWRRR